MVSQVRHYVALVQVAQLEWQSVHKPVWDDWKYPSIQGQVYATWVLKSEESQLVQVTEVPEHVLQVASQAAHN